MTVVARTHDRAIAENGVEHRRVLIANERAILSKAGVADHATAKA